MAVGADRTNRILVRGAEQAMDNFKYEIAQELGITGQIQNGYWGNVASRDTGAVGGNMVRRMIAMAEQQIAAGTRPPALPTEGSPTVGRAGATPRG